MPRFLIERDVSGWTAEDLDVAALRAKLCAPWFDGLEWIISYHDTDRHALLCVYDAHSEDDIRAHARFAGLPAGAIRQVEEIDPADIDRDNDPAVETAAVEAPSDARSTPAGA